MPAIDGDAREIWIRHVRVVKTFTFVSNALVEPRSWNTLRCNCKKRVDSRMSGNVFFDFTLDNIISVKAPKVLTDTLHDQLREKLRELIDDNCEAFMFEGIGEERNDE